MGSKKAKKKLHFIQNFTETFGIGSKRVTSFCLSKGVNPQKHNIKTKSKFNQSLEKRFKKAVCSIHLRTAMKRSFDFYWKIRIYKGFRHRFRLPSRGQRTHTNARTKKRTKVF